MKKLLFLPVLFVFFTILVSCVKRDDNASKSELLVGLWTKHFEHHTPGTSSDTLLTLDDTLLFRKDGTGLWKIRKRTSGELSEKYDHECKWRIDSNRIYFQIGDNTSSELAVRIGMLTADTLKFAYLEKDTTYEANTFRKIE